MRIYSHSSLESFERCPRQFWYRYIGRPKVAEEKTIEAFLGTCVHTTLELLYALLLRGRALTEADTIERFEAEWAKGFSAAIVIVSEELTAEDYKRAGRAALAAYYRRHAPFTGSATLRLEARVALNLDAAGTHRMQGYVDRIARRDDGTYEIHDYKTSSHLPTQAEADADRQLALYQIGLEAMWMDVEAVDLIWHYLRFDTDLVSHRTREQLREVRQACIAAIDDIESRGKEEAGFPTHPSNLCAWCAYNAICPATRHEAAVAALPPEAFELDDGVRLVDEWAQATEQRKAAEGEAARLKAVEEERRGRVEAFAEAQGLEVVVGSEWQAEIVASSGCEYPKAGSERRPAFEEALKATGVWEQVAAPSHQRLAALLADPHGLAPEARARLEAFLSPFASVQAKLRRKKDEE